MMFNSKSGWSQAGHVLVVLALFSVRSVAQGGQGGFGGGGMGGRIGEIGESEAVSYKHILTPGDRGEWPLTVRAGECVIVFVTSTSFDPAAQIVDSAGKVLAENDDIRPGVQDSLILYRFATAGDYRILVKGFKSVAGGQYELTLRRFLPTDLRKGERNTAVIEQSHVHWHRFTANAGETLVITTRSAAFEPNTEIYQPNGERLEAEAHLFNGGQATRTVFRADTRGDYYLRIAASRNDAGGYAVTVASARVASMAIGGTSALRRMDAGGLDLWTFAGAVGDMIQIKPNAGDAGVAVGLRYLPTAGKAAAPADSQSSDDSLTLLPSDPKARGDIVALLKRVGTYQIEVSQPLGVPVDYALSLVRPVKTWAGADEMTAKLALGNSDYWAIDGKSGQIVQVEGLADLFDIDLDLYNPQGEQVESNDDGAGGRNALLTALLKESGRYLLRAHAFGNGGSGPYRLRRRPNPVHGIQIGGRSEGKVGAGSREIWSFAGKAGQTLILSVRSPEFDPHVNVFGPDAIEVVNNDAGRQGTDTVLSLHLPLTGSYTIWISTKEAGGKYVIRLIDAD